MAEKISINKRNIETRLKSLKDWKTAEESKEELERFVVYLFSELSKNI